MKSRQDRQKEYDDAKDRYHQTGSILKKTKGRGRAKAERDYQEAKRDYQSKGKLLKTSRPTKKR